METVLPVVAAFLVVFGMLGFLAYCGKVIDAESERVDKHRA